MYTGPINRGGANDSDSDSTAEDEADDEGDSNVGGDTGADAGASTNNAGGVDDDAGDEESCDEESCDEDSAHDHSGDEQEADAKAMMMKKGMTLEHHEGDKKYQDEFIGLYPFSNIDFFITEKRETGLKDIELGTEETVKVRNLDTHYYAEPKECDICLAEKAKIAELERENAELRQELWDWHNSHDHYHD